MSDAPTQVLSDFVQAQLAGRRVLAAVFLTYTLEPHFFETEVLPLLAGDDLLQNDKLRLVQLEEELRTSIGPVAVYYDPAGLKNDGPKRLSPQYVPVRVKSGVFHPKLVLLLTEPLDGANATGSTLLCGVLSANLTKSGWWENLECAHFETVEEGAICSFGDDLIGLLGEVRKMSSVNAEAAQSARTHEALDAVQKWLRKSTTAAGHATLNGRLRPRLLAGKKDLLELLLKVRGEQLHGSALEVVSPFFDKSNPSALRALRDGLALRETRVFLPTNPDGSAQVASAFYAALSDLENVFWASLPKPMLSVGSEKNAKPRYVHAKVYRFLKRTAKYEALLIGSHNLTRPAHLSGNFEASFLIEREFQGTPDWWLQADAKRPRRFETESASSDGDSRHVVVPLEITYDWQSGSATVCWYGQASSPALSVRSAGAAVFEITGLDPRSWRTLAVADASALRTRLVSSAVLEVRMDDGTEGLVLVQEYGVNRKPSILLQLSPTEILEYWARLTPAQRALFLEQRVGDVPESTLETLRENERLGRVDSFFDSYAGIYHGFEMLRAQVLTAVEERRDRQADALIYGNRHDSLPVLIERVLDASNNDDALRRYLTLLCARQLLHELKRNTENFFVERRAETQRLIGRTNEATKLSKTIDLGDGGEAFLEWFEAHFLKSVRPTENADG